MQEIEITEYHVHEFVKRIVDLTKEGYDFKDFDSIHYTPQAVGSHYFTVMVKAEKEQPQSSDENVAPETVVKEEAVAKRSFGGRPKKAV